jgi:AcrR family transcriptional regulator
MSADDRRRAIVAAIMPLLIEKGSLTTSAEMAQAAGIAEGTIFRVFPDKSALIYETVRVAMDPSAACDAIRAISPSLPMKTQLANAARILLDHWHRVTALAEACRSIPKLPGSRKADGGRLVTESAKAISAGLGELFARHRAELRIEPAKAAMAFRGLIFASAHPFVSPDQRLTVDDLLSVLLSGIAKKHEA